MYQGTQDKSKHKILYNDAEFWAEMLSASASVSSSSALEVEIACSDLTDLSELLLSFGRVELELGRECLLLLLLLLLLDESPMDLVAATSLARPARIKYALKPVAIIRNDSAQ
jgi:hypothetical protein